MVPKGYSGLQPIGDKKVVYRGRDLEREIDVVLKRNHPELFLDVDCNKDEADVFSRGLLRYEHALIRSLDHDGVCKVLQSVQEGDYDWLVLEDIGGTLQTVVEVPDVGAVLLRTCKTIQYLHDNGVVHRDITPQNISSKGVVMDFDSAYSRFLWGQYSPRLKGANPDYKPIFFDQLVYDMLEYDIFCFSKTTFEVMAHILGDFSEVKRVLMAGQSRSLEDIPPLSEIQSELEKAFSDS